MRLSVSQAGEGIPVQNTADDHSKKMTNTIKLVSETTYIKQFTALRDHCSYTTPFLNEFD